MVVVPLKAPQAPAPVLPQLTDQVTPALAGSLLACAFSDAAALVSIDAGAPDRVTEIAVMVIVAEADLVGSVTEVAVTITVPPAGAAAGAVYMVGDPLAVVVTLNVPQAPALPQVTAHVTPRLAESLLTTAANEAVAPGAIEPGSEGLKITEITPTVMLAMLDMVVSVTEVAIRVTMPLSAGMVAGAV